MDQAPEESIRAKIREINEIPTSQMTESHFKRLNDLEAEIVRRRTVQEGKFIFLFNFLTNRLINFILNANFVISQLSQHAPRLPRR